jgi:hypothetical protein
MHFVPRFSFGNQFPNVSARVIRIATAALSALLPVSAGRCRKANKRVWTLCRQRYQHRDPGRCTTGDHKRGQAETYRQGSDFPTGEPRTSTGPLLNHAAMFLHCFPRAASPGDSCFASIVSPFHSGRNCRLQCR